MTAWVVEIAGVHGSGKSTIAASLAKLGFTIVDPSDLFQTGNVNGRMPWGRGLEIVRRATALGCCNPTIAWHLVRYWIEAGPNMHRARQALRLASWLHRLGGLKADVANPVILEEGVIHLMAEIPLPSSQEPHPGRLVASALPGRIDALVHVNCNRDVAFSRVRRRVPSDARVDHWPDDVAQPSHRLAATLISLAVDAARSAGICVLEIDATDTTPAENALIVAQWLHARRP